MFDYIGQQWRIGTAFPLFYGLTVGFAAKCIYESMQFVDAIGYGVDVGLLWQRGRITLGGVIQNMVRPKLDWSFAEAVDSYIPTTLSCGGMLRGFKIDFLFNFL